MVILSWYFPTANRGWGGNGMYYTNYWSNASAVDQYVTSNLTSLQAQTQLYHDTLYSSNLPQYVLDRITSATAILHTPTMWWAQNGFFGGYEGYGCCDGMPNHVWHYAQADARLWPQIGQMIDQQWLNNENSDGSLPYRYTENRFAFDGQAGVILSTYRDYLNSQNTSWLNTYWPKIKGAMNYMVTSFDPNHNGILQGAALTTLDQTQPTMGPWLGSMYLAAVNASAHMASLVGDSADASLYQNIYTKGQTNQENMLWNGQLGYYVENPQNAGNAQHFVGNGMDIDMLLGQWWSTQLGLGDIYNSQHITLALQNLSKYNFKPNFVGNTPYSSYTYSHQWRDFVEPTDGGIVDTTWPNNDQPSNSIWYFDETQSGYEYAAATEMLQRGLLNQGLQAIKTLSNRYDGTLRNDPYLAFGNCGIGDATGNPFGDDECGKWYGRSMSSWSALLALQGFSYNASQGAIGFNPGWQPNNHKSFFTAANGWGTFNQQQNSNGTQSDSIKLAYGTLSLKTITLAVPTGTSTSGWTVTLNGQNMSGANIICKRHYTHCHATLHY